MKSQRMRTLGNAVETPAAHMVFMMKSAISLCPLGLALGSPIFPSGCEGKLGVAPGESGLVSRGSQGLRSPLESRRGSLGAP